MQSLSQLQNDISIWDKQLDEETSLELWMNLYKHLVLCESIIEYSFVVLTGDKSFNFAVPLRSCIQFLSDKFDEKLSDDVQSVNDLTDKIENTYFKAFEHFRWEMSSKYDSLDDDCKSLISNFIYRFTHVSKKDHTSSLVTWKLNYFNPALSPLMLFDLINYYKHVWFAEISHEYDWIRVDWYFAKSKEKRISKIYIDWYSIIQFMSICVDFSLEVIKTYRIKNII